MAFAFRHAICNEVYGGWDFAAACRSIRAIGYTGIEIAPFTLNEFPASISAAQRVEYRRIMADEGLDFVGLHWLMVAPKGLHVTTPDLDLRAKSWRHIVDLIDLCADLAGNRPDNGIMVFGSPKQRTSTGGMSASEALRHYTEGLASVAPHAASRNVTILAEALPSHDCDVMNTLEEAAALVRRINSPAIRTMFDTHNAADETDPHPDVVEKHFSLIRHIHVNEMDGRHPGTADYPFTPLLARLARLNYGGWISLEAFDFTPGAEKIASESLRYIEKQVEKIDQ